MKDIIWLSPSLAAGAIAARIVVFFERRPQMTSRRGVELTTPSRPGRVSNLLTHSKHNDLPTRYFRSASKNHQLHRSRPRLPALVRSHRDASGTGQAGTPAGRP
jgi:hypothetical protein